MNLGRKIRDVSGVRGRKVVAYYMLCFPRCSRSRRKSHKAIWKITAAMLWPKFTCNIYPHIGKM